MNCSFSWVPFTAFFSHLPAHQTHFTSKVLEWHFKHFIPATEVPFSMLDITTSFFSPPFWYTEKKKSLYTETSFLIFWLYAKVIWVAWCKVWLQGIFAAVAAVIVSQHRQVGIQDGDEKFYTNLKPQDFQRHCTCFSGYCIWHSLESTEGLDLVLLAQGMCCTLTRWVLPINHMQVTYFRLCTRGMGSLSLVMHGWCFLVACSWNIAKLEHFTEMSLLCWH